MGHHPFRAPALQGQALSGDPKSLAIVTQVVLRDRAPELERPGHVLVREVGRRRRLLLPRHHGWHAGALNVRTSALSFDDLLRALV